jgi:hypothetical protein
VDNREKGIRMKSHRSLKTGLLEMRVMTALRYTTGQAAQEYELEFSARAAYYSQARRPALLPGEGDTRNVE